MAFLVELAQLLAGGSRAGKLTPGQQQLLQESLHLVRDVCARDDSGWGLVAVGSSASGAQQTSPTADLVAELRSAGVVPSLLAMLKALEPIQNPQQRQAAAGRSVAASDGSGAGGGIRLAELAPQLAVEAARFPSTPPYPGFRSDLLAALANAVYGRSEMQASAACEGGRAVGERAARMLALALPALLCCPVPTRIVSRPTWALCRLRWGSWGAWSWCWRSASWTGTPPWRASGRSGRCATCARATQRHRWAARGCALHHSRGRARLCKLINRGY